MTQPRPVQPEQFELTQLDVENLLFALHRCVPIFETLHHLSFQPKGPVEAAWDNWCENTMRREFIPAMQSVYEHAIGTHVREILEIDHKLANGNIGDPVKLCKEGHRLLFSHLPPQSERTLQKYFHQVQNGESPAHFLVVYTLRAAAFHIPFTQAIKAYLFLEAMLNVRHLGSTSPEALLERFYRTSAQTASKDLRAA
ncbi:MAG: hypothetical protein ABI615_08345 [Chthoniobacterales bacterium]